MNFVITTAADLTRVIAQLGQIDLTKQKAITVKDYSPNRRLSQNRLAFFLFDWLAKETGNGKDYERNRIKLAYAVPILRRDSEEFDDFWLSVMERREYIDRLNAMEWIQVSSLFSVKQFTEFLEDLYQEDNGYVLPKPEDLYYDALGIKQ